MSLQAVSPNIVTQTRIEAAVAVLQSGGTVAFPTETVYGLGADASNPLAVRQIFKIKGRPVDHPLIVHIENAGQLDRWARDIPDQAYLLAETFWPGALTLILQRQPQVLNEITGGQDTVGLRSPDHPVAAALLRTFGSGIAAPSANRFGRISPTTAQHVWDELGRQVGLILDGGVCRIGLESTILSLAHGKPVLLRPGGIAVEALETTLKMKLSFAKNSAVQPQIRTSGMMAAHYAPVTPMELHSAEHIVQRAQHLTALEYKVVVLALGRKIAGIEQSIRQYAMPAQAEQFGHDLYAALHSLDQAGYDYLLLESPPTTRAWLAVNDRLQRATHSA
ncbi:MAG: L-threonylcarbamoyladenylate synthase [Candidatus Nitrotoga sp.]